MPSQQLRFRSKPCANLSGRQAIAMIKERGLSDALYNHHGQGLIHRYEKIMLFGVLVVVDWETNLTWQQAGSERPLTLKESETLIHSLNQQRHAGHADWRLPTLEEAMTLMENKKRPNGLYLDDIFDRQARWIWTADHTDCGRTWAVDFQSGSCYSYDANNRLFARAVR